MNNTKTIEIIENISKTGNSLNLIIAGIIIFIIILIILITILIDKKQ